MFASNRHFWTSNLVVVVQLAGFMKPTGQSSQRGTVIPRNKDNIVFVNVLSEDFAMVLQIDVLDNDTVNICLRQLGFPSMRQLSEAIE